MSRSNAFYDILSSIFDRAPSFRGKADGRSIRDLCEDLLSSKGEVSGYQLGQAILDQFDNLGDDETKEFFRYLTEKLDVDTASIITATSMYRASRDAGDLASLTAAAEPRRQELLRRINQVPNATVRLVRMREKLIEHTKSNPEFSRTDLDFERAFNSWFNRGFLVLRRIEWQSPANILQRIIQYEAVHAIDDWDDLKRRVDPEDRRCYAFFHPSMPDDPLIFVEVALCRDVPDSIKTILADDREILEREKAHTAVFYSISNCQKGLRGISFGNSLIKQVVQELQSELPDLKRFITLSPMPRFRQWLISHLEEGTELDEILKDPEIDLDALGKQGPILKRHAARYQLEAKNAQGFPLDPVARFHLGNGALVHDLHPGADFSPKGLAESSGVMVNYMYDPKKVEQNHESFAALKTVAVSKNIRNLVPK